LWTRHIADSLQLLALAPAAGRDWVDIGSGAGFPGLPIKLLLPEIRLTLVESQNKKATFLREVIRTLGLHNAEVYCGRAENWGRTTRIVTLRAVEKFEDVVPVAARLVAPDGTLALLIGESQTRAATDLLGLGWKAAASRPIPKSAGRTVWLAQRRGASE